MPKQARGSIRDLGFERYLAGLCTKHRMQMGASVSKDASANGLRRTVAGTPFLMPGISRLKTCRWHWCHTAHGAVRKTTGRPTNRAMRKPDSYCHGAEAHALHKSYCHRPDAHARHKSACHGAGGNLLLRLAPHDAQRTPEELLRHLLLLVMDAGRPQLPRLRHQVRASRGVVGLGQQVEELQRCTDG